MQLIESLDKQQVSDLFDQLQRVAYYSRPECIPQTIKFLFQFASYHLKHLAINGFGRAVRFVCAFVPR
jgi:hypothetical protein